MKKVEDVLKLLEEFAPLNLAEDWDNVGLLVGSKNSVITGVLCSLDITLDVIDEAIEKNCNLIIAHHPLIFTSVRSITNRDTTGNIIIKAIGNNIAIICMHTNLDATIGGVNDALANKLELLDIKSIDLDNQYAIGRTGKLKSEMELSDFLDFVKTKLCANGLKFVGNQKVSNIAVIGGSGSKYFNYNNGCDTFITGDCPYDIMQKAYNLGVNLIDAGHFATEDPVTDILVEKISKICNCEKSENHHDIVNFR